MNPWGRRQRGRRRRETDPSRHQGREQRPTGPAKDLVGRQGVSGRIRAPDIFDPNEAVARQVVDIPTGKPFIFGDLARYSQADRNLPGSVNRYALRRPGSRRPDELRCRVGPTGDGVMLRFAAPTSCLASRNGTGRRPVPPLRPQPAGVRADDCRIAAGTPVRCACLLSRVEEDQAWGTGRRTNGSGRTEACAPGGRLERPACRADRGHAIHGRFCEAQRPITGVISDRPFPFKPEPDLLDRAEFLDIAVGRYDK